MRLLQKALTFDDVLLIPAHSSVLPREVSLKTRLTRNISLNMPLVSAAMDTVTESRLAIALAQEGGIGIIHKNLSPQAQAAEVVRVKRFESGVLKNPITVSPSMTVHEVLDLSRQHRISGFPVLEGRQVVGIVTNRDLRFETQLDQPIRNIMTPRERLVTVHEGASIDEGKALIHKHRIERVLVVNDAFELCGLITVKDIIKTTEHPNSCKDSTGRLRVGAAVGVGEGTEERVALLAEAGVDVIMISEKKFARQHALLVSRAREDENFAKRIEESALRVIDFKIERGILSIEKRDGVWRVVQNSAVPNVATALQSTDALRYGEEGRARAEAFRIAKKENDVFVAEVYSAKRTRLSDADTNKNSKR